MANRRSVIFLARIHYHILIHVQQYVSRKWSSSSFWQIVVSYVMQQYIGCEWDLTFLNQTVKNAWPTESESHYFTSSQLSPSYDHRKWVIHSSLPSRFISSHCLTNRMWVILPSSLADLTLVNKVCKWHCFLGSYNLFYDCQLVSNNISYLVTWIHLICSNNRKWVAM